MSEFRLRIAHEWIAHDPFGRVKPTDASSHAAAAVRDDGRVELEAPRGGYASFRLLVEGSGTFTLDVGGDDAVEIDCFRAWYHRFPATEEQAERWLPDALIPLPDARSTIAIPDPDNAIPDQCVQELWIDCFVGEDVRPGPIATALKVSSNGTSRELTIAIEVLEQILPTEPCVEMDHNSYGCRKLAEQYPETTGGDVRRWHRTIDLLHHQYRLFHEHRGHFKNLGYEHSGAFDPIYGPRAVGRGRELRLEGWELHDAHYGPLLSGDAFETPAPGVKRARRAPTPLVTCHTPFNPNWPASYMYWGEAGYEVELLRGLSQFDEHLRERGWTRSRMEFFMNHKKRYRWFEWDGDEVKYRKDHGHHHEMIRMLRTVSDSSPVRWIYRYDSSWYMKLETETIRSEPMMWITGGFNRWYPEEMAALQQRGDIVWSYAGGPSAIHERSSLMLQPLYDTWARGFKGFCHWLANQPDADPWFGCTGNRLGLIYPGERFGIAGPIPSIRLKVQRNAIQDIDLLDAQAREADRLDEVRAQLAERIPIRLWQEASPTARILPPEDWDSRNLKAEHEPHLTAAAVDPMWWQELRAARRQAPVPS